MEINKDIRITDGSYYNMPLDDVAKNAIYSTDEIVVGRWINGKPLYRKVFITNNNIQADQTYEFSHGIINADLVMVKNAYVTVNNSEDGATYPLNVVYFMKNTTIDRLSVYANRKKIGFIVETGWGNNWTKIVILEYTKTTD